MSKKTFSSAPKPKSKLSDAQILAFEQGGAGHDHQAKQAASSKIVPTKRLSLDLPESLHTRFKTACSASGRKMGGELLAYIEQRTAELEEEAGLQIK